MTVGTDRSASDIIDGLFKRVEQVERQRVFLRDESGNIEFESPINVGGGTIIGGDAAVAPTNLVLTPGVTLNTIFVDISWDPSANVSYYNVLVVENVSGIVHTQVNVGGESTRITGLEPNTLYDVSVRAIDNIGRSSAALSGQFTSVGDTTAPPQVIGLSVTAGIQSLVATWNESTAEDVKNGHGIYEVQIDTANTFNTVNLRSVRTSGTITSWTDLDPDTTYYVRVKAIDSSGNEGVWSATGSGVTGSAEGRDFTLNPIQTTEIADNAITSPKVAANAIEAGHLVTGTAVITGTAQIADAIINSAKIISLDAALVTFGTMSGDRIAANSMDVGALKASTLSARTITLAADGRFLANGASGSLYIDGTGIQLFDAINGGGTRTVYLDTATGNASFTGEITATSGTISGQLTIDSSGHILIVGSQASVTFGSTALGAFPGLMWTGTANYNAAEGRLGYIAGSEVVGLGTLTIQGPTHDSYGADTGPRINLVDNRAGTGQRRVSIDQADLEVTGGDLILNNNDLLGVASIDLGSYLELSGHRLEWNSSSGGTGAVIRVLSNPSTDASIFEVQSSGLAYRFRVGHGAKPLEVLSTGLVVNSKNVHTEVGSEVRRTTTQSVANATWTTLTTDDQVSATGGASRSTSGVAIPATSQPGWYLVTATVVFVSVGAGTRCIIDFLNDAGGDGYRGRTEHESPTASPYFSSSAMFYASSDTTIGVQVWHDSGASRECRLASLSVVKVSPIQV